MKKYVYIVLLLLVGLLLWWLGMKKQSSQTITETEETVQIGTTTTQAEAISTRPNPILNE